MTKKEVIEKNKDLKENLKIDCSKCFGLCCVSLYFMKSEGFPCDKVAGVPCTNLDQDYKCKIHKDLNKKGFKGCTTYECLGVGQKVSQVTFKGEDWIKNPEKAKEMFDLFPVMLQLHEMLWYLSEALIMQRRPQIQEEIYKMIEKTLEITNYNAEALKKVDLVVHKHKVNELLFKTSRQIRKNINNGREVKLKGAKKFGGRINFIGEDLKNRNLRGQDLSGALLMASDLRNVDLTGTDLLGADLRDADLRGADLSKSIYVTQEQINSAKGDKMTRLPKSLRYPERWKNN